MDTCFCVLIPMEERVALATGETVVFLEGNGGRDFPGKKEFMNNF